ncbi:MAG: hypothetical protein NC209_05555 [Alistipes sp.]|nr:hypothetical protein [Alistipes senegalensis]MCM1250591.1 hypothetical protein [Alistipes sp.]
MKFNIARQAFIPAFLTLAALAATAVYWPEASAFAAPAEGSGLRMPGELLLRFQYAFPEWARALCCLAIISVGLRTGHLTVRYNLYTANTCIAIPLYGALVAGLTAGKADLLMSVCSILLILALRNFCRSYSNNYAFDAVFRGSLYLGLLVVLLPQALPLPLAIIHFHRTAREWIVAIAGLLLPAALLCYVNWGAGNPFHAPLLSIGEGLLDGRWFRLLDDMSFATRVFAGGTILCLIFALQLFFSDLYAVSSKSRTILVYHIEVLLLVAAVACMPDVSTGIFALPAVPLAVLLPLFFVRSHPAVAQTIYAVFLAGALFNIALQ